MVSNSVTNLLGYQKIELIGKKIETIMPNIYIQDHNMVVAKKIAYVNKNHDFGELNRYTDGRALQIAPRTKSGYLVPVSSSFEVYNDDDFS